MTRNEASRLLGLATVYRDADDGPAAYFWQGYADGVRRALHGEAFNRERHELMLAVTDDDFDDARRLAARGYRAGLEGVEPENLRGQEETP